MTKKILVVDDEPDIRELLALTLKRMDLDCDCAANLNDGIKAVGQHEYFLILTDMRLPDGEGIELVKYVQKNYPQLPIAVITAYGNVEGAVNALKAGAFDYVSKPVDLPLLKSLVKTALSMQDNQTVNAEEKLVGQSQVMQAL